MKCILCLKIPDKPINIFGEQGLKIDMKFIISKHFWFEPNQDDDNSKLICSSCWLSVEDFHKFYEEIEEAHCSFQEIKPVIDVMEDDFPDEGNDNHFSDANMLIDEDIKIEVNESNNVPFELQCNINPLEIVVKSDEEEPESESEMPLAALSKQLQSKDKIIKKELEKNENSSKSKKLKNKDKPAKDKSSKVSSTSCPEDKDKDTKDEILHIHEGKWLATCYAEETYTKPISSEELDKFLKLNIELLCGLCQQPMDEFACLHPHFVKCHNKAKPFVSCCGRKLKYRAQIIDHILFHKIPEYFKCTECSKVWPSRRNLKEHLSIHNKNFIFNCEKCNKSFSSKPALERHHEVHFEEKPFQCDICDKFYATEYRLKQHAYNMHHYKKICEQCGQVFREKETFMRHLLKHTNEPKPYFECEICGARLSSKKVLQKHNKFQHLEDAVEQNCNLCGITVKNLQAFKRHMNFVHKYQREHKCSMCDKAFKRALSLKEHMTTHTGEVLYTCPHCPKTFNSNANMHSHRKKMHRKEWEENRRHPHMGHSAQASVNNANANAMIANATEENNQQ